MKFSAIIVALVAVNGIKIKSRDDSTQQLIALAGKLGMETTPDMFDGQSPEDATNAIIGAALESGKTQADIEAVMGGAA